MALLTSVFQKLLAMALTALPVTAVVLLARFFLRKAPKKFSCVLWLAVAFRLVCPVAPEGALGIVRGAGDCPMGEGHPGKARHRPGKRGVS